MARTVTLLADVASRRFFVIEADGTRIPLNRDGYSNDKNALRALARHYTFEHVPGCPYAYTVEASNRELEPAEHARACIVADHEVAVMQREAAERRAAASIDVAPAETAADVLAADFDHDGAPRARGCTCDGYQLRMVGCDCPTSDSVQAPAVEAAPVAHLTPTSRPTQRPASPARRGFLGAIFGAGFLALSSAPAAASRPVLRGGDANRLPDHAAFWGRLPLPFSPAEAWRLLSPEAQTEIGAAIITMHLAEYIHGDGMADADQFHDAALRDEASTVANDILNRMGDRLWSLFPDLYGPDGDHPPWALYGGFAT